MPAKIKILDVYNISGVGCTIVSEVVDGTLNVGDIINIDFNLSFKIYGIVANGRNVSQLRMGEQGGIKIKKCSKRILKTIKRNYRGAIVNAISDLRDKSDSQIPSPPPI